MEERGRCQTDRTKNHGRDILLIDGSARFDQKIQVDIEEHADHTLIITNSEQTAIELLTLVMVDEICHRTATGERADADGLRARIAERHPHIPLFDSFSILSRRTGEDAGALLLPTESAERAFRQTRGEEGTIRSREEL